MWIRWDLWIIAGQGKDVCVNVRNDVWSLIIIKERRICVAGIIVFVTSLVNLIMPITLYRSRLLLIL